MKKILLFFVVLLGVFFVSGCNQVTPTITVKETVIQVEMEDFYVVNPVVTGIEMPQLSY